MSNRSALILVIDSNPVTRNVVRSALGTEGFTVLEASGGREAIEIASQAAPDLIVQDLALPDIDGFELIARLRSIPAIESIPIIAYSGMLSRVEYGRAASLGFTDFLQKPVNADRLLQLVESHLPHVGELEQIGQQRRVLVVDDSRVQLKLTRFLLADLGFEVTTALSSIEGLALLRSRPFDVVLSDVLMPQPDGFRFCAAIRNDPTLAHVPVVLMSSNFVDPADREVARRAGANAMIERAPRLTEVIVALQHALTHGPQPASGSLEFSDYSDRMLRQLDRQVSLNDAIVRRAAIHAAILSVTSGIAETLTRQQTLDDALPDVLTNLLVASNVARGALFIREAAGAHPQLVLATTQGFTAEIADTLRTFCGHKAVFDRVAGAVSPLVLGSSRNPEDVKALLRALAGESALLIPLVADRVCLGILVLVSRGEDLLEHDWAPFARSMGLQIGQAFALSRTIAKLAESESRYRRIVETASEGVWTIDANGVTTFVNARMAAMLGYEVAEMVGHVPTKFLAPEGIVTFEKAAVLHRARQPAQSEIRFLRRDGTELWTMVGSRPIFDGDGRPDGVLAMVMDMTERRAADTARRQSEARFKGLWDSGMLMITITDLAGNIRDINDAGVRMLGYSREELIEGTSRWADLTPPAWYAIDAEQAALLRSRGFASWEKELVRKDGVRVPVLAGALMIEDEMVAISIDLSAAKLSERAHKTSVAANMSLQAQLQQSQKMDAIGRLAGGIAHDFNNLLSVILSYGEMLVDELPASPVREDVEEICRAGHRAADLTRQLLMFSRQQVIEPKVLDLNERLLELDKMVLRILGADVEVLSLRAEHLGRVHVDPGSIEQVILNLIVNARDAMPTGGKLTIETANVLLTDEHAISHVGVRPGRYVMLSVTDTGTGMDEATRARIFEPFFTTKAVGKGTGLGLATVFGIVDQFRGAVLVSSSPGNGARFEVYIPRVDAMPERDASSDAIKTSMRGTETILLVEDDEQVRNVARTILRKHGYTVMEASNAGEAMLLAEGSVAIDMLLSDVVMPQMSGPELAKRLAKGRPAMKILCMSGYTDDSIVRHGVLEGALAFLQKPITSDTLSKKVRDLLDAPHARS
ncbi:MAG: Histidine kinase [Myxococcales bacterium]|nr:Histidine kinase [Myxococcales bacterium]